MNSDSYLFREHPRAEIQRWATTLRYFRFCRAAGGHANDGDSFLLVLRYQGQDDLLDLLSRLGVTPRTVPPPRSGDDRLWAGYTAEELARLPDAVPDCPGIAQPGRQRIREANCFLWAAGGRLAVNLSDSTNEYEVTEASFVAAQRIEEIVASVAARIVEPPEDNELCICPKYHSYLWA